MPKEEGERAIKNLKEIYPLFAGAQTDTDQVKYAKLYFATIFQYAPYDTDDYLRLRSFMKGKAPVP